MASRSTSRSNRRTNSSKAARFPACASMTRDRSSSSGKEVTVASTAFVPPDLPALSAKANVQWGSGMFAFSSSLPRYSFVLILLRTNGTFGKTRSAAVSPNLDAPPHLRYAAIPFILYNECPRLFVSEAGNLFHVARCVPESRCFIAPAATPPGYLQERLSLSAMLQSAKPEVLLAPPRTPYLACDRSRLAAPAVPHNPPTGLESPASGNSPADLVVLRAQRQRPLAQEIPGQQSTASGSPLYFPSLPPSPAGP